MITAAGTMPAYDDLLSEIERLKIEKANLKRLIFGQKRERYIPVNPNNQLLFPGFDRKNDVKSKRNRSAIPERNRLKK